MRYSVATGLVLAAFTVSDVVTSPTHAHMHARHHHAKKEYVELVKSRSREVVLMMHVAVLTTRRLIGTT